MQRLQTALAVLIVACLGAGIATAVIGKSADPRSRDAGKLATLLDDGRADTVAALVAPVVRDKLTAAGLATVWSVLVEQAGQFQGVAHTYTVDDGDTRRELEVLSFAHGLGTLSAVRANQGITGMLLMVGTSADNSAKSLARTLAQDLVDGNVSRVVSAFDETMRRGLSPQQLSDATVDATAHLHGPAEVVAQVTVDRQPDVIVENYVLFRNGLIRVEVTLDADRQIAGLYLRLI